MIYAKGTKNILIIGLVYVLKGIRYIIRIYTFNFKKIDTMLPLIFTSVIRLDVPAID